LATTVNALRDSKYWRERAEEARTVADSIRDPQSKAITERGVALYEQLSRLADDAERRENQSREQKPS
jgi:hypothetical protein